MSFKEVVNQLNQAGVPCSVSLTKNGEVLVECGTNYPDELVDIIHPIVKASGMKFSICADASGYDVDQVFYLNYGGPHKRWPLRYDDAKEWGD